MLSDHGRPALVRTHAGRRTLEFAPGDVQSEMLLARPTALVLDYARAMMAFSLFVPAPRHIVMVGLGGGSLAKFCHRHYPSARITVLEVRSDVIALRDQFFVPPDDTRFAVVHADAVQWMARAAARPEPPRPDVLLVDGFDAAGLPDALSGAAFYRDCRRLLAPGGVLVANVFTYDPRYGEVLAALGAAFQARLCWLDGVAGNNRIVYALADGASPRALRRQVVLARRHGRGRGWVNRWLIRLLLILRTWRTVLSPPHWLVRAAAR